MGEQIQLDTMSFLEFPYPVALGLASCSWGVEFCFIGIEKEGVFFFFYVSNLDRCLFTCSVERLIICRFSCQHCLGLKGNSWEWNTFSHSRFRFLSPVPLSGHLGTRTMVGILFIGDYWTRSCCPQVALHFQTLYLWRELLVHLRVFTPSAEKRSHPTSWKTVLFKCFSS